MEIFELYNIFNTCSGVCTDTRKITENCLFFALKGDHFDANTFALEALKKGASFAVVDDIELKKIDNPKIIIVDDSLEALQELAAFHRYHLGLPIIGLTGSNGKTTSKELIQTVLTKTYNSVATIGNLNNHIGVPLSLLNITEDTDIGLIEMGANHLGEIEELCDIALPDFGYITNFGRAHLEGFGGIDGVIKGKSELYNYLYENQKSAFINFDDTIQVEKTTNIKRFGFSTKNNALANVQITKAYAQPMATIEVNNTLITSNLTGVYNIPNLAIAVTIGLFFNIAIDQIKSAIEHYIPQNNRSQWMEVNGKNILLDAYNANPSSMLAAIENFKQLEALNKMMILGDMFELGTETFQEHQKIINEAIQSGIPTLFVGSCFDTAKVEHDNISYFPNLEALTSYLQKSEISNNTLLIKGSRGMALEKTLDFIS